jgi:hypothetical protein
MNDVTRIGRIQAQYYTALPFGERVQNILYTSISQKVHLFFKIGLILNPLATNRKEKHPK